MPARAPQRSTVVGRALWPLAAALLLLATCAPALAQKAASQPRAAASAPAANPLLHVKSWGYQLRGVVAADVAGSPYDAVVIDYADGERPFSAAQLAAMRRRPDGGSRLILAYLSVGEAERYRYYWQTEWYVAPPGWLGPENPQWRGNYPVRHWDRAWQRIVYGEPAAYLDRIMAAGFDGVYLDRIDVYPAWEKENPEAKRQMMDLVAGLGAYAKYRQPGFLVVAQNAEELLEDKLYLGAIDAVAKEDLLYGLNHTDDANPQDDVRHSLDLLRIAKRAGKAVLVVEYICRPDEIARADQRLKGLGFVPHFATRALYRLGLSEDDYCKPRGDLGRRVALVIGNGAYQHAPGLRQPGAEARAIAAALRAAGFASVLERPDLTREAFDYELQRFADLATGADWALVSYSGLGLSLDGEDYVLPVDARLDRAAQLPEQAIASSRLFEALKGARHLRLAVLDACRANAFLDRWQQRGLATPALPGLSARAPPPPVSALYASRCRSPRLEKTNGIGALADALATNIERADLDLGQLVRTVREVVLYRTDGAEEPLLTGAPLPAQARFRRTESTTPAVTAPSLR
jgi:cysteinyl-tRNA synthetase